MTDRPGIICKRCGFANQPGDQFCGSCGAFLEWEGTPATSPDDAPTVITPLPPTPGIGAPGAPSPGSASPAPTASAAGPTSAGIRAGAPARPELVRCSSCGIANPATRTFCQSCGTTLASATRVEAPSEGAIAAALGSSRTVPPAFPGTVPVTPAPPRPPIRREAPGTSRGIPGWVFAVGGFGLLIGAGVVAFTLLFAGKGPGSTATTAPSVALGSGAAASGAGASGATGGGSAAAPAEIPLTGATASSVVDDLAKFQPERAIDGNPKTSWQEGASNEKGEWIEVTFAPSNVATLVLENGYQASTTLYKANRRLKDILVTIDDREPIAVRLKDSTKAQRIDLGGIAGATRIRITIVTTYAPVKTAKYGKGFDDAALSEISVLGTVGG